MTTRKRSLILSVLALALSLALFATGTYALFTDEVKLTNHLQAGTLDLTLTRTSLISKSLDSTTGFLVDKEDPIDKDFSEPTEDSVFGMAKTELIVPHSSYTAEMKISNTKSDVAFGYWLQVVYKDTAELALADQILVTVTTVNGTTEMRLSQILGNDAGLIGNGENPIGVLAKTGEQYFTVSMTFLNLENSTNNLAKSQSLKFDIIVHAVQVTKAPS